MEDAYRLWSWALVFVSLCGVLLAQEKNFEIAWEKVRQLESEHKYAEALENVTPAGLH